MIAFQPSRLIIWILIALTFSISHAFAQVVSIPIKLEHHLIQQALIEQVFTRKNQSYRVIDDGSGCNKLELAKPKVDTYNGFLRVRLDTHARIGQVLGSQCLFLLDWRGKMDLLNTVKLSKDGRTIHITTVDSKLLNKQGQLDETSNQLWQWIQRDVYPLMNKVSIDLNEPLENIKAFLPAFIGQQEKKTAVRLIDSFAINNLALNPHGILLNLQFDVPVLPSTTTPPAPMLTKQEIALLEKKLNALDAFVTFTIQSFLTPNVPDILRTQLLESLINLRYEVTDLLDNPGNSGPDPVKKLFLTTWQEIAPVIREISRHQGDQTTSLHYLTFIAANDVLLTIEQIGPSFGMDVSIDGLRRLARLLNDNPAINPLDTDEKKIPEFHFDSQLTHKEISPARSDLYPQWLDFFIPNAVADNKLNKKVVSRLNSWVPKKKDMNEYLPMVQQVLSHSIEVQIKKSKLDPKYHKIYRSLVYTTAWQESCWRQYEAVKRQRWPLKSHSGDLGMMQINPRVWRGFYSIHNVKWDIVYNANAGAEIIMYYLQRYALRHQEHIKTGRLENLARATYSGYNGGPRQYARYRDKTAPKQVKRIDDAFYKKFKEVYNGDAMAVKSCYPGI